MPTLLDEHFELDSKNVPLTARMCERTPLGDEL